MAEENKILYTIEFNSKELDKQLKEFGKKFRAAIKESLKDIDLTGVKALKLPITITAQSVNAAIQEVSTKQLRSLNLPVKITAAAVNAAIADINKGITATIPASIANANKTGTKTATAIGSVVNRDETVPRLDSVSIDKARQSLVAYREELRKNGLTAEEITKSTRKYETALTGLENRLQRIKDLKAVFAQTNPGENFVMTDKQLLGLQKGRVALDELTNSLQKTSVAQVKAGVETERTEKFMDSFGFKIGILGFGAGILAGHLQRLAQNMTQFYTASAKAVEPLQRVQNLLRQDPGRSAGQSVELLREIRRLSDLPGGNLDSVVKSFRSLASLKLGDNKILELIEGITKATALSGTGAEGTARLIEQLRQFVQSGVLTERDVRTISEQGGVRITDALQSAFGTTNAEKLQTAGPVAVINAIIEGLKVLPTPLETATDKLNRMVNSLNVMRLAILEIADPGISQIISALQTVEVIVTGLQEKFRALPAGLQQGIGTFVTAIPIIATALAGVLTILSAIAIAAASVRHGVEAIGVVAKPISTQFLKMQNAVGSFALKLNGIIPPLSAIGVFFSRFSSGAITLRTILASLSTGIGVTATGLLRLLGLLNPIGIAINLIVAYLTDWGDVQKTVNAGITDLIRGVSDLAKGLKALGDTGVGRTLLGTFEALYNIIEGIIRVFGSAFAEIVSIIGAVLSLVGDFIGAFNEETWAGVLGSIGNAFVKFFFRLGASITRFVTNIAIGLVKTVGTIMERLSLLPAGFTESAITSLQDFNKWTSENVAVVRDGKLVFENYAVAQNVAQTATDNLSEAIKTQTEAFKALKEAAESAAIAANKAAFASANAQTSEEIEELRTANREDEQTYRNNLNNLFTAADIDREFAALKARIDDRIAKIEALGNKLYQSQITEQARNLLENPLIKAVKAAVSGPDNIIPNLVDDPYAIQDAGVNIRQALADFEAGNFKSIQRGKAAFEEAVASLEKNRDAVAKALNQPTFVDDLKRAGSFINDTLEKIASDTSRSSKRVAADLKASLASTVESTEGRKRQLNNEIQNLERTQEIKTIDAKIEAERLKLAEIDVQVEKFKLTATLAREKKVEVEYRIAELERDRDVARLQAERDRTDPANTPALVQIDKAIAERTQEKFKAEQTIRAKASADQAEADQKALDQRNKRFASAADELLKILEPYGEAITTALALGTIDGGDQGQVKSVFGQLANDLTRLGETVPELQKFITVLREGTTQQVTNAYLDLLKVPASKDFEGRLQEIRNKVQAIIRSAVSIEDGKVSSTAGVSESVQKSLGITVGTTEAQLESTIQRITDLQLVRDIALRGGIQNADAEIEELIGLVTKAEAVKADIDSLNLKGRGDLADKIFQAISEKTTQRLSVETTKLERELAEVDESIAKGRFAVTDKYYNELRRKIVTNNIRIIEIEKYYKLQQQLNDITSNEERLRLTQQYLEEVKKLYADANKQLTEEGIGGTVGTPGETPSQSTSGAEAPDFTKGEGSFSDLIENVTNQFERQYGAAMRAAQGIQTYLDTLASGANITATFQKMLDGQATSMDLLEEIAKSSAAAIGSAFVGALRAALEEGENFFVAFGRLLGQALMNMGMSLIASAVAATAFGAIWGVFTGDWSRLAIALKTLPVALAAGAALIGLGALLGGASSSKAASANTANKTSTDVGSQGEQFDANRDPRLIYQKALMAQIEIDIKTDDTQVVNTVIKHVNQNGRLARLIGNRKLQFGY